MSEKCEYCWNTFKHLKQHQQTKYCQLYKYVVFTCIKCKFSTRGIKNIEHHVGDCTKTPEMTDETVIELQKKLKERDEEILSYKENIKEYNYRIDEIKNLLRLETFKNKIYRHIILINTSIRIEDVVEEKEDGLHVFNYHGGDIPIFVNDCLKDDYGVKLPLNFQVKHSPKKLTDNGEKSKKKSYRPIKSVEKLVLSDVPSSPSLSLSRTKNIEDDQEQVDDSIDIEKVHKNIDNYLTTLKTSRNYSKVLEELRNYRNSIMTTMNINEYYEFIQKHISTITQIFQDKNYSDKKYRSIILKGLSPLESRITAYGQYISQHLEVEDIQRLQTILELYTPSIQDYIPFDSNIISSSLLNYGSVLFPIQKNIERVIFNKYGYNNLIYLPLAKNTEDDPYSFYTLDKINKGNKYWKMDCRLEDFTQNIIEELLPFLISTFRKIYKDIFNDNDFRENYSSNSQITECDCEQLLLNILLLGQPKEFCYRIRGIVKKKAVYKPEGVNDKFNLQGDDSLQKKRFQEKDDVDLVDIIKQLFDSITSEDAVDFYRSKINLV